MTGIPLDVIDAVLDDYDARMRAREAEVEARECVVCGSYSDGLTNGECDQCWLQADRHYERLSDS